MPTGEKDGVGVSADAPLISVVIPSYKHAGYIRTAIDSVLAQSLGDFELLISDDASPDDSWAVISRFTDARIRVFRQVQNLGPVGNLVFLIRQARGKYVALLNSDDVWHQDKLDKQVAVMEAQPSLGACFTWADMVYQQDQAWPLPGLQDDVFMQPNRTQGEWLRRFFFHGNCLCHPSVLVRREIYEELGAYRPGFRQLPDFEMWIRLVKHYPIHVIQESLVTHLRHDGNTSAVSPENTARNLNELLEIAGAFFDDLQDEIFIQGFAGDFRARHALHTRASLQCEKLFLLLACPLAPGGAAAIAPFMRHFPDAEFERVLRDDYQFGVADFYRLTGSAGFGHLLVQSIRRDAAVSEETRRGVLRGLAHFFWRVARWGRRVVRRYGRI